MDVLNASMDALCLPMSKAWARAWCYVSLVLIVFCISASQSVLGTAAALASLKTHEDTDSQRPYQVH